MSKDDHSQNPQVAAIFATRDRMVTARECVASLAAQTHQPRWVIVADNFSADDTVEVLERLDHLPFELVVLRLTENKGNAGGVNQAMLRAFDMDADAVWILDDDSWPRPEALAEMLAKPWQPDVVRHALQIDPQSGRFTWPLQVADEMGGWRLAYAMDELPSGNFISSRAMWTGALVSREVWMKTGSINESLFIRGEDEEYPWRIEQAGFQQEAVKGALMDHPGPKDLVHLSLLGKHFFLERGLSDWKLYYKIRNMVWLKRQQSGVSFAVAIAAAYTITVCCIDGIQRLPLVHQAVFDGLTGKLGKWKQHTA
jgi:rhamnopyranosyl-N-acetylglucosaminyl-diphospho-decaprenol beta-1,3/1,4-galactofuranosyltransferase